MTDQSGCWDNGPGPDKAEILSAEQLKIMKSVYNLSSKTYAPSAYDLPRVDSQDDKDGPKNKIAGLKD
jgi:hypothetical protein